MFHVAVIHDETGGITTNTVETVLGTVTAPSPPVGKAFYKVILNP